MKTENLQIEQPLTGEKSAGRLFWVVPTASLLAILANVIFYYVVTRWFGEPLLMINQLPSPEVVPMGVGEVILFSLIFSLGAGFVYALLRAVSARPERNFIIVSAIVLLLSFALPLKIPTPPVAMTAKLTLVAMHIVGAIVVVGALVTLGRKRI